MNPQILVTATPRGGKPHITVDVFDREMPAGQQTVYQLNLDLDRPVEDRAEWARTYAHYVLFEVAQAIALELDRGRHAQVLDAVDDSLRTPGAGGVSYGSRW